MATQANIYSGRTPKGIDGLPQRMTVKLGTGVSVGMGEIHVVVSGYGARPAAANAATGKCAGMTTQNVDNASGADGDLSVVCESNEMFDFKNDATHPCSQADVNKKVYASDKETISNNSGDGPLVGVLKAFNASDAESGRPCRVLIQANLG